MTIFSPCDRIMGELQTVRVKVSCVGSQVYFLGGVFPEKSRDGYFIKGDA
jgi:hypothetical protein